jgi:hypothetical protein
MVRSKFPGNAITVGAITSGRSRTISAPRGIAPVDTQPFPFPGTSTTRMRHPSRQSISGYGPLDSSFSRASGIVMQVVTVSSGCETLEGIRNITGWGGGVFSPAFRRILSSSESPTRSQQPMWPSGMGVSIVRGTASASEIAGGRIGASDDLFVEC